MTDAGDNGFHPKNTHGGRATVVHAENEERHTRLKLIPPDDVFVDQNVQNLRDQVCRPGVYIPSAYTAEGGHAKALARWRLENITLAAALGFFMGVSVAVILFALLLFRAA